MLPTHNKQFRYYSGIIHKSIEKYPYLVYVRGNNLGLKFEKITKNYLPFIFLFHVGLAQTNIDSLVSSLPTVKDTAKVELLVEISSYFSENESNKSLDYAGQALALAQEIKYKKGIQEGLHAQAIAFYHQLDYENALKNYREELDYLDTLNNLVAYTMVLNNIGLIYEILGDCPKAIQYHQKGVELMKNQKNHPLYAVLQINLAIDYSTMGEFDSTRKYIRLTQQLIDNPSYTDYNRKIHIQIYIAELYHFLGDDELAYYSINMALSKSGTITNKYTKSSLYLVLGKIYERRGMYHEAIETLNETVFLAQEIGQPRREMEALGLLSEIYKKTGNFAKALNKLEQFNHIKDSTYTIEKNRQILEIEAKYESDRQENEIEILKKTTALNESELVRSRMQNLFLAILSLVALVFFVFLFVAYRFKHNLNNELSLINTNLRKSEAQLLNINAIKDSLIRVIGHDLKGPLNAISGFSELLLKRDYTTNPEKLKKFSGIILKTSLSVNQLLDNILYWVKLQNGGYEVQKKVFDVKLAIIQGVAPYEGIAENKNIKIHYSIEKNIVAYGDSFSCSIIVGNLVNNALKFSHKNSCVQVKAQQYGKMVHFLIIDEGVGISEDRCKLLFDNHNFDTTYGTNNEKGTGFGLKICKQFVILNNGEISVKSTEKQGAIFKFTFPGEHSLI